MAHLGKQFPRQFKNFLQLQEWGPAAGPTRKMSLVVTADSTTGTVADLWDGGTFVSEIADYWPDDPLWTLYDFVHPDDADAVISVRAKLNEMVPLPGDGDRYRYHVIYEAYYAGAKLGDQERLECRGDFLWWTPGSGTLVGPVWNNLTDVPKWFRLQCRVGAATWAQQPEYHPYRHE